MVEITSNILNRWSSLSFKDNVDIHKEMTGLTLDIVTGCVFGSGMMKNEHLREIIHQGVATRLEDIEHRTYNMIGIIPIINQLPLPSKRRIDKSKQNVKYAVEYIIDERKKGLSKSPCKGLFYFIDDLVFFIRPDLLDLLLSAHGNDKTSKFTDEELFQEAITFDEILFNIYS